MTRRHTSEKWLEARLFELVRKEGGHALKFSSASEVGFPDRLVLMPRGKTYWVELKSEGEKPRRIQAIRHAQLRELGFEVFVIDTPEKLEEFMNHIKQK